MGRESEQGDVLSPGKSREKCPEGTCGAHTFAYAKFIHLANYPSFGQGWINEAEREEEFSKFIRWTMKKETVTNYTILQTAS